MASREVLKNAVAAGMFLIAVGAIANVIFPDETERAFERLMSFSGLSDDVSLNQSTPDSTHGPGVTTSPTDSKSGVRVDNETERLHEKLFGDDLENDLLLDSSSLSINKKGLRSGQAVLDALAEIENWSPIEGGYNPARLKLYLRHPKLWVRVSAYAFALKAKLLSPEESQKLAQLIKVAHRENISQLRRFLTRYERKDHELFEQLNKRLILPEGAPSKDVPVLEGEADNADSS